MVLACHCSGPRLCGRQGLWDCLTETKQESTLLQPQLEEALTSLSALSTRILVSNAKLYLPWFLVLIPYRLDRLTQSFHLLARKHGLVFDTRIEKVIVIWRHDVTFQSHFQFVGRTSESLSHCTLYVGIVATALHHLMWIGATLINCNIKDLRACSSVWMLWMILVQRSYCYPCDVSGLLGNLLSGSTQQTIFHPSRVPL